jgi:dynein heavy chain
LDAVKDKLSEIALRAAKEIELVKMLEQVESVWRGSSITVQPYRESKEIFILGNNEDLIAKIDDTLLTVNNILASRFVEGIRTEVEK